MPDYVLGVSMSSHDRSAALLRDGQLIDAIAEERLDRRKRSQGFYEGDTSGAVLPPLRAITKLLREHEIRLEDLRLLACGRSVRLCKEDLLSVLPIDPDRVVEPPAPGHHLAHAYSAYGTSPFRQTAVLVLDEQGHRSSDGSFERGSWFSGEAGPLVTERRFAGTDASLSLGMFFDVIAALTGLSEAGLPAAGKLMALAAFGQARSDWPPLVETLPSGDVGIALDKLDDFLENSAQVSTRPAFSGWPVSGLGDFGKKYVPAHWGSALAMELARHAQDELERGVLHTARALHEHTGSTYLSYAGGVALNCTANARLAEAGFRDVFVHPAATDDGCAVGLAYYGWLDVLGQPRDVVPRFRAYLGPSPDTSGHRRALDRYGLGAYAAAADPGTIASQLADGKLVCRFVGRSEWGPRALGNRSILADPASREVVKRLNSRVKFREPFRPFGVSITADAAPALLRLETSPAGLGPFMLSVADVRDERLRGMAHADGTIRYQIVDRDDLAYHSLIEAFGGMTGLPAVLNTSFNTLGEPLVESPGDAVRQFLLCNADVLVLDDTIIDLTNIPEAVRQLAVDTAQQETRTDSLALALRQEAAGYPEAAARLLADVQTVDRGRGEDYLRQFHALKMRLSSAGGDTATASEHAAEVLQLSGLPRSAAEAAELLQGQVGAVANLSAEASRVLVAIAAEGGALRLMQRLLPPQVPAQGNGGGGHG